MPCYSLRSCDRSGRVLHDRAIQAADVYAALAHANRRVSRWWGSTGLVDPLGRIDIAAPSGATVARVICAEVIAGRTPA